MARLAAPPATALPPRASSDGTLRRVQEAALEMFAERGYHGVSMRDLASAAGVQPSSLYAHVPSKERLLLDLVLLGHEEHRSRLRQALIETTDSPADQLASIVRAHVAFHVEYPTLAIVCNNEMHALGESSQREVRLVRDDAERTIHELIERGVQLGRFDVADTWLAAAAIGAMGLRTAIWFRRGTHTKAETAEAYAEFALRIVGARA